MKVMVHCPACQHEFDAGAAIQQQVEQQAAQLSSLAPVGRFDRLEIITPEGRIVCQVQPDRRLFVRRTGTLAAVT